MATEEYHKEEVVGMSVSLPSTEIVFLTTRDALEFVIAAEKGVFTDQDWRNNIRYKAKEILFFNQVILDGKKYQLTWTKDQAKNAQEVAEEGDSCPPEEG